MLQAIKADLLCNTLRVFGKFSSSQSIVVLHLYSLGKSIWNFKIVPHITKILQNFLLTLEIPMIVDVNSQIKKNCGLSLFDFIIY